MQIGYVIKRELADTVPVLVPIGFAGTVVAYILSQNIFMSLAAAASPTVGVMTYYYSAMVVEKRSLKLSIACTSAIGLAILCGVPSDIFVLTSLFVLAVASN